MPRFSIRLEFGGRSILGPRDVRLLEEIAKQGSIVAASREVGLSPSTAWRRIHKLNSYMAAPIVKAGVGGPAGGGAMLTSQGKMLVRLYRLIERDAYAAIRDEPARRPRSGASGCLAAAFDGLDRG
jgi:molybdate transport system regulatory protein